MFLKIKSVLMKDSLFYRPAYVVGLPHGWRISSCAAVAWGLQGWFETTIELPHTLFRGSVSAVAAVRTWQPSCFDFFFFSESLDRSDFCSTGRWLGWGARPEISRGEVVSSRPIFYWDSWKVPFAVNRETDEAMWKTWRNLGELDFRWPNDQCLGWDEEMGKWSGKSHSPPSSCEIEESKEKTDETSIIEPLDIFVMKSTMEALQLGHCASDRFSGQFLRSTTWHRRWIALTRLDRPVIPSGLSGRVNPLEAEDGRRPVLRRGCYNELKPNLRCGGHMRERPWLGGVFCRFVELQCVQYSEVVKSQLAKLRSNENKFNMKKIEKNIVKISKQLHANWIQLLEMFGVDGPRCAKDAPWMAPQFRDGHQFRTRDARGEQLEMWRATWSKNVENNHILQKRLDFHGLLTFLNMAHDDLDRSEGWDEREMIDAKNWYLRTEDRQCMNAWGLFLYVQSFRNSIFNQCQMCHDKIRIFWSVSHKSELEGQGLCDIGIIRNHRKCSVKMPHRPGLSPSKSGWWRVKELKEIRSEGDVGSERLMTTDDHHDLQISEKNIRQLWLILAKSKSVQCAWIGWMLSKMSKTRILICTQFGSTCQAAFITTPGILQRVLQLDGLGKVGTCCDAVASWRVRGSHDMTWTHQYI